MTYVTKLGHTPDACAGKADGRLPGTTLFPLLLHGNGFCDAQSTSLSLHCIKYMIKRPKFGPKIWPTLKTCGKNPEKWYFNSFPQSVFIPSSMARNKLVILCYIFRGL